MRYYKDIYGDLLRLKSPGIMSYASNYRPVNTWLSLFDHEYVFSTGLKTGDIYAVPDSLILLKRFKL